METKNYIVAVDIGSSEVVVAVGSTTGSNIIKIEAIASEPTIGVNAGLVENNQMVAKALRTALDRVEQELKIKVSDAYATISGKFVRSARYTDHVFVEDAENCIEQRDLRALHDRMLNVKAPDDEFIMELYPIEYKNDKGIRLSQPVGAYSKQLTATYNFILCERLAKDRLRRSFMDAGISLKAVYAGGAIIAESLVSSDEKQEGVAIVDIGSGVTDIAIYHNNALCHMTSLPIGGSAINNDISHFTTNLPAATVEKLKIRHGAAVASADPDSAIQISSKGKSVKQISLYNLEAVVEARMTEIAEYVWREIREAGLSTKLPAGIILTGGGANLNKVAELFHKVTGLDVRVASAEVGVAMEQADIVADTKLTLAISLLLRGARNGACPVQVLQSPAAQPVVEEKSEEPEKPLPPKEEDDDEEDIQPAKKPGLFSRISEMFSKTLTTAFSNPDEATEEEEDF